MDDIGKNKAFSVMRSNRLKSICAELKAMKQTSYKEFYARKSILFGLKRKTMTEYFEQLQDAKIIEIDTITDTIRYMGE